MNTTLIYVTFSSGDRRGFLTGKAALRYAEKRGLQVVAVSESRERERLAERGARELAIADAFTPPNPFGHSVKA